MFNMGQRVRDGDIGDVVLPLPYSDEGVLLSLAATPFDSEDQVTTTLDLYARSTDSSGERTVLILIGAVSCSITTLGLRGVSQSHKSGLPLFESVALLLAGNLMIKLVQVTRFYSPMSQYFIYGFDVSYRHKDLFRLQAEYAQRSNDRYNSDTNGLVQEHVEGVYVESECRLQSGSPVSFLCRYDWLRRGSPFADPRCAQWTREPSI
jgi:hypothetical protein